MTRRKRALFSLILILGIWAFAELAGLLMLSATGRAWAWPSRLARSRAAAGQQAAARAGGEVQGEAHVALDLFFKGTVIHPFLGYVMDPQIPHGVQISAEGFSRVRSGPPPAGRPRFTVGIFGGSMAMLLCHDGWEVLARELRRLPQAQEKEPWLECYALGGYKQPQSLLALDYALARGERFDLVITLDGFNEMALPTAENLKLGVNPFYPRSWNVLASTVLGPRVLRISGEIAYLEHERASWAGLCDGAFAWSSVCHVIWQAGDRRFGRRVGELERELLAEKASRSFAVSGPGFRYRPQGRRTFRELVDMWSRSSTLMAEVCRARGISYFHFLQPNQYLDGSKPLGKAERSVAFDPDHPYRPGVVRGYPLLIEAGKGLAASGVPFHDLTRIFAAVEEPLYFDTCCHVNARGSQIMAREMAARIAAAAAAR
jgi:hypothetical protein